MRKYKIFFELHANSDDAKNGCAMIMAFPGDETQKTR